MKKFYLLALLFLTISLTICKADGYQSGFVILKNGKRVGGQIKLYKNAPWKNQRYIWFKDSAAVASNPNAKPKKLYASDMKFYQAGTRQFVKVSYFDQAFIKLRNLYSNSWMLERVSNGRFVAYMFYSSPPEFFDYFFADPKGDQTEPAGNDNAMLKYRIIFKKNGAKHFVNAYSYNLAKYFQDTPQILDKYQTGKYGNQPDVDGSMFDRLSEICNRTIFTSHAESAGIIAAFNDYNQFYAPKMELPAPTPAQSTADLFKPYWFKGAVIDNNSHKGVTGATVSYIDSATQQVVKSTSSDSTGGYAFYVTDRRPFGIKVEKKGFFTQNLTGIDASTGKAFAVNSPGSNSGNGTSSAGSPGNGSGSAFGGNASGGGSSASGAGSFAANGSKGAGNGSAANGGSSTGGSSNGSGLTFGGNTSGGGSAAGSGGFAANGSKGAGNAANGTSSAGGSGNGSGSAFGANTSGGGSSATGSGSFAANGSKGSGNGGSSNGNSSNGSSANGSGSNGSANGSSALGNGMGGAAATGAVSGIGASGQPLSAKYMRYINSSRYKHSKYYKEHMQHERELAKEKAASDAAGTSGLLAGNPSTGSSASGNGANGSGNGSGTNGSASRAFAGGSASASGSASGSNGGSSNNGLTNGNGSNGSANGGSSNGGSSNNGFANGNGSNGSTNGGSSNNGFANGNGSNGSANGSSNDGSGAGASSQALAVSGKITDGKFISPDIRLQSYSVNKPIVVNNILYDYGFATLRPESITVLDGLVKTMIDNPNIFVELSAHTDSVGSDAYNVKLSQDRAQTCVSYIISKGVDATRITAVGYGKSKPIAPNSLPNGQDNPDGRQLNRRIEFVVKKNDKIMSGLAHR